MCIYIYIPKLYFYLYICLLVLVQTYIQLETQKSNDRMKKMIIKKKEIEEYLTSQGVPVAKKKIITRYLGRSIKHGKQVDVQRLIISIFERHVHNPEVLYLFIIIVIELFY